MENARLGLFTRSDLFSNLASVMTSGIGGLESERNDRRPPAGCRGQDAVISDEVELGNRSRPYVLTGLVEEDYGAVTLTVDQVRLI